MLKFSKANVKLQALAQDAELAEFLQEKRKIYSLDLLSGWSCPFAHDCLSKVHQLDGKRSVIDGKHTKFRCFSASQEALYTNVYNLRNNNYQFLRSLTTEQQMVDAIQKYLPKNLGINRFDVKGAAGFMQGDMAGHRAGTGFVVEFHDSLLWLVMSFDYRPI